MDSPSPRGRPVWTPHSHAGTYLGRTLGDGRFVIRKLIGRGGMALVFLADDRQDGRPVAIKICRDDDPDSSTGRRFAWEARVLANLEHPNLVGVLATGETLEGNPYMVQPYLAGDTLRSRLAGGPLGWRVICEIGAQIADVLHALHMAGVVHRDVKPDNIVWTRYPTQPVWVKLIDLGLAKLTGFEPPAIDGARVIDRHATEIGYVLGTEGYRPPEAVDGVCTPRFDVFSLGVTLYELCANVMPYPDLRPLAEVRPGWDGPPELEAVIREAIELDPERRLASADIFRRALEAVRDAHPDGKRRPHLFAGWFHLTGTLGTGAKATTHAAYDRELRAPAAIKILSPEAQANPDERLRFELEATILRHIRHPNLPEFFEYRAPRDDATLEPLRDAGQSYIVMELCPGKRAREYTLSTTCLAPADVVRAGIQLTSALAALHEAGIVYRDLTWDNVLIHFAERDLKVKLIDFNAVVVDEERFFARLDERWRTPPEKRRRPSRDLDLRAMNYAAPEVRAGAPWSTASDVFALGVLLYQLLTGQNPFPFGRPDRPATPPRRRDCPENLKDALMGALELDPGKRVTLAEVAGSLELAREELELDSVLARETSVKTSTSEEPMSMSEAPGPSTEPRARSGSVAMLAAAVLVGVALGVVVMMLGPQASTHSAADPPEAQAPAVPASLAANPPPEGHPDDGATPLPPVPPPTLDLETALDGVADALKDCATKARQGVTVELAAGTGDTRLASIDVFPADAALGRCVRDLLEPLRFTAQPHATTIVRRYLP